MNPTPRLLEVTKALSEAGVRFLIMGGHAVRYYGVDRNTLDFDFHVAASEAPTLQSRLAESPLFAVQGLREGVSWRPADFRRFQIGSLPGGREEWLEFWFKNHLLSSFEELYSRCEKSLIAGRSLCYLSLPDLIRSKETERDDDWADIRLLEEILDERNLSLIRDDATAVQAISQLRSRRGFDKAQAAKLLDSAAAREAILLCTHPVSLACLLPYSPGTRNHRSLLDRGLEDLICRTEPGSPRHLALVEAARLAYQRAAKLADREDKERRLQR